MRQLPAVIPSAVLGTHKPDAAYADVAKAEKIMREIFMVVMDSDGQ